MQVREMSRVTYDMVSMVSSKAVADETGSVLFDDGVTRQQGEANYLRSTYTSSYSWLHI